MSRKIPRTATCWVLACCVLSFAVHAIGMVSAQYVPDWTYPNVPLHSFAETSGGVFGLVVAVLLVVMDRLGRGTSCNAPLVFGLTMMAVLDCLHAIVAPGENFVWLHSAASFAGGINFATACLLCGRSAGYRLNAVLAGVMLVLALGLPYFPEWKPAMVANGEFTFAAMFLNVGGGVLMIMAAFRYLQHYSFNGQNHDDLLFAFHCLLFGGASIMFEQSQLWDFSWWWWHLLRLLAYAVALIFAIQAVLQLQMESKLLSETYAARYNDQQQILDAVLNSVSDGIIAENESGEFLVFNKAAQRLCTTTDTSVPPQSWSDTVPQFELGADAPLTSDELPANRVLRGERVVNEEVIIRHPDRDVHVLYNGTRLESQDHSGVVVTIRDVTEMNELRDQLHRAQKLESIGQLAAGVAHEINTPMQFIGDNIEFLSECSDKLFRVVDRSIEVLSGGEAPADWNDCQREIQELTDECRFEQIREQIPDAIEESREGVKRTVKIVRAMKEFSHPGTNEMAPGNLNELIESTVAISRNRWKYAAEMQLELAHDLPEVPMLASEINQVLLNLIVNAADAIVEKYTGREDYIGTIAVRTAVEADWVVVEVEDDGCGIPDTIKRKVFDPFFTTKEVGKGTGQGLAITHNVIVNQHGGLLTVDSEPGKGTRFSVKLPRQACSTAKKEGTKVLAEL